MATKRNLKVKYEALKELEKSRTNKDVAKKISIPGGYSCYLEKNNEKICEAFQNSSLKRQRVKIETYETLNEPLLKWFTSMRGIDIPIKSPILLEKAPKFAKPFYQNNFTASSRWLGGWKIG